MTSPVPFQHSVLVFDSDESVREVMAPAVRKAIIEADRVFVAVSDRTASLLRQELGAAADEAVEWSDALASGQRLGFAYEGFRRFLASAHAAGQRVEVFSEPDIASDTSEPDAADRAAAYLAYEATCNVTYSGYGCGVTCLWDARQHPTLVIEGIRRLHNQALETGGGREQVPDVISPRDYLAGRNEIPLELPEDIGWAVSLADPYGLPQLRDRLAAWADGNGFDPAAALDVVIAVNEIATNGLTHGEAPATVAGWRDGETLIVQVDDQGGLAIPPLAGYVPPGQRGASQRGLWLARQLADVVRINTTRRRTSVRLYFPRWLMHRSTSAAVVSPRLSGPRG